MNRSAESCEVLKNVIPACLPARHFGGAGIFLCFMYFSVIRIIQKDSRQAGMTE
jgi:hypothetical protein